MDLSASRVPDLLTSGDFPSTAMLICNLAARSNPYEITQQEWQERYYRMDAMSVIEGYRLTSEIVWAVSFQRPETLTDDKIRLLLSSHLPPTEMVLDYPELPDPMGMDTPAHPSTTYAYNGSLSAARPDNVMVPWRDSALAVLTCGTGSVTVGAGLDDLFSRVNGEEALDMWLRWYDLAYLINDPRIPLGMKTLIAGEKES